jgi:hypothetical protein
MVHHREQVRHRRICSGRSGSDLLAHAAADLGEDATLDALVRLALRKAAK